LGIIHLIQWVPGLFPGRKCVGLDVRQSPPSSAEVNNEWTYTSTPRLCREVERPTFIYLFIYLFILYSLYSLQRTKNRICISANRFWKRVSASGLLTVSRTCFPWRLFLQCSRLVSSPTTEVIIQESDTAFRAVVIIMLKTFPKPCPVHELIRKPRLVAAQYGTYRCANQVLVAYTIRITSASNL